MECAGAVAFVALHAVLRGRSFGGLRIWPYESEEEALLDALALSRAMTRKVVLAGIEAGGAKAVLIAPRTHRAAALRALGEFVESLAGRFNTGPDMGYTADDDRALREATRYVACGDFGDATARGVRIAMRAVVSEPRRVAVQGLGAVGRRLAELLLEDGVHVVGSDFRPVSLPGVELTDPDRVHATDCEVFAPCARGGVLGPATIPELRCEVVCGAANNPLLTAEDADRLLARGVTLVPDFVANAGAVIQGASTVLGEADRIPERMAAIADLTRTVVSRARHAGRSPLEVAAELADARTAALR